MEVSREEILHIAKLANLNLTDDTGLIDESTLKYIITKDKEATPNVSFTNGSTLTLSGIDGEYYIIVKGCDQAGNCTTKSSNPFYLDNTKPTISVTLSNKNASN